MDSVRSVDLEDYWNEWRYLEELEDDDHLQPLRDGEQEANWLRAAGFESLVQMFENGQEVSESRLEELLGTLSRSQQQAVRRRLSTLSHTAKKRKHKQSRKTDVRELFPQAEGRSRSVTPDSLDSLSPSSSPSPPSPQAPPKGRLSPHSQGYHSNSAGSLDALSEEENPSPILAGPPSPKAPAIQVYRAPTDTTILRRVPTQGPREVELSRFQWPRAKTHYALSRTLSVEQDSPVEGLAYHQMGTLKGFSLQKDKRSGSDPVVDPLLRSNLTREKSLSHSALNDTFVSSESRSPTNHLEEGVMSDHELPDIVLVADALGLTRIQDVGEEDLQRVQSLALIEMTSLFDQYNISYSRRKPSKKKKKEDSAVFGVPLTTHLEKDRKKDPCAKVPVIMKKVVSELERRGLKEEGLLRIPGSSLKTEALRQVIEANLYSKPERVDAAVMAANSHDLTAIVKQFIRDLPEPLLTLELIDAFCKVHEIDDLTKQVQCLTMLIILLPIESRELLRFVLVFLGHVIDKESANKMSLYNVAMIIAPNLLIPKKPRHVKKEDMSQQLEFAASTCRTMKMLIKYREILWTIPSVLLKQVRREVELHKQGKVLRESNKPVLKMLSRKHKELNSNCHRTEDAPSEKLLRVKAPQFHVSCAPCRIDQHTVAKDILSRFIYEGKSMMAVSDNRNGSNQSKVESRFQQRFPKDFNKPPICSVLLKQDFGEATLTHSLYEVGGNIGERRLRSNANMMALYLENPHAEWVVRCNHAPSS